MEKHTDKNLEAFTDKVISQLKAEKPSVDFTQHVMQEIEALREVETIAYVPLISKKVWVLLSVVFVTVLLYIGYGSASEENVWLSQLEFMEVPSFELANPFDAIEMSLTMRIALIAFGCLLFIQIPLLKRYFDKQFAM